MIQGENRTPISRAETERSLSPPPPPDSTFQPEPGKLGVKSHGIIPDGSFKLNAANAKIRKSQLKCLMLHVLAYRPMWH